MTFEVSRKLMGAMGTLLQITGLPLCDEEVVKKLENWFRASSNQPFPYMELSMQSTKLKLR